MKDPADQQRKPKQSQVARETQTSFAAAEDVCTEVERLSPNVAENTAADKTGEDDVDTTDYVKEGETKADIYPVSSEVDVVEEKEETRTTKGSEPEPEDLPGRPGSPISSPDSVAAATGAESVNKEGAGERDDTDDDVGIAEGKPEEAVEQAELKEEAVETTKEVTEGDNAERSCSAEPDVDSSSILGKHPERFIVKKRDDRVRKRESRSLRYLKVLQASVVTQLKW